MPNTLRISVLFFLFATSASAQAVYVVAPVPGPGVFSTDIQPAINAAVNGDLVLVKAGAYSGFTIDAKGVSVVADAGANVVANGLVFVSNISASQSTLLQGLTLKGDTSSPAVILLNNPGAIWIESCNVTGSTQNPSGLVGVQISTCPSVVIQRCVMTGGSGITGGTTCKGAPGLHVANSTVTVGDSTCSGGSGATPLTTGPNAGLGAAGMRVLSSTTVFASGTTFKGGNGAPPALPQFPGGSPGSGISTDGAVTSLECTITSGHGSPNFPPPPPVVTFGSGSYQALPGVARHFATTSPVREGQTTTITAGGVAGELTGFLFSTSPGPVELMLPFEGTLVLPGGNADWFALGAIPAGGTLSTPVVVPNLPPTVQSTIFWCQSVSFDAQFSYILIGPASAVVVLDSTL
ncbi:MAG: hypothetical protein HY286_03555 [Planctomycetes bacterium]|nr:hypothetical protein [Planctomycetota bacterium]